MVWRSLHKFAQVTMMSAQEQLARQTFIESPTVPAGADPRYAVAGFKPQSQAELCGVVLDMADVVNVKFGP